MYSSWKVPKFKGYTCIITFLEVTEYFSGVSVVSYCSPVFHRTFDSTGE